MTTIITEHPTTIRVDGRDYNVALIRESGPDGTGEIVAERFGRSLHIGGFLGEVTSQFIPEIIRELELMDNQPIPECF